MNRRQNPTNDGTNDSVSVPALSTAIRGDLEQMAKLKGSPFPSVGGIADILSLPGTWAVIIYRLASTAHYRGIRPLSRLLFFLNSVVTGAELHPSMIAQPGLVIPHPVGSSVGGGVRIGRRVVLFRNVAIGGGGDPNRPGQPVLGDDVHVMDSVGVFGQVRIGDRSIIGAHAVVASDVAADMFVHGPRKSEIVRPLSEVQPSCSRQASDTLGERDGRASARPGTVPNGRSAAEDRAEQQSRR